MTGPREGRHRCARCGATWTVPSPRSDCPGVPLYRVAELGRDGAWERAHAAGLHTKTQWKKQGRILLDGAEPAAAFETGNTGTGRARRLALYREDQTRPVKAQAEPAGELFGGDR